MKFQYEFQMGFIRLAAKNDLFTEFKLMLTVDLNKTSPSLKNKYFHQLQLARDQRILNLKQLQPFHFTVEQDDRDVESYSLEIRDTKSGQPIEQIPLHTATFIRNFQKIGKTIYDMRHEGTYFNINFKVYLSKKQPQKDFTGLNTSIKLTPVPSKQEGGGQIRQTFGRGRRPPQLNISKKSQLRQSQRLKQQAKNEQALKQTQEIKTLFKGLAEKPSPTGQTIKVNIIEKQKQSSKNWEPLSAFPETLSAWLKKKVKPMDNQVHQVNELVRSHHPVIEQQHHKKSKLSIKLKIVIGLLIFGFCFLIFDMLKKQTYRFVYGKYPKPAGAKHKKTEKRDRSDHQSKKQGRKRVKQPKRAKKH